VDQALPAAESLQSGVCSRSKGTKLSVPFDKARVAVDCRGVKAVAVIGEEESIGRLAQPHRLFDDRVEHREEIAR
jgi:hypothetical protein